MPLLVYALLFLGGLMVVVSILGIIKAFQTLIKKK